MSDLEHSTLWRVSAFERARGPDGELAGDGRNTQLPTSLLADLQRLHGDPNVDDALEVMAACVRHREPALLYLAHGAVVWPVTLFPVHAVYHSPRDIAAVGARSGLSSLRLIGAERAGVRPPGHPMHERVAAYDKYHPLAPMLWEMALHGPRASLLSEIGGRAAYRLAPGRATQLPPAPGALTPATERLRQQAASLRDIARWPGMSVERACRLLNALYLHGGLMVSRSHPAARGEPVPWYQLLTRQR